jgi:hypothetical protein
LRGPDFLLRTATCHFGPTACELIEQPHRKSARPHNVIVGHLIAVIAGLAAVYATHAWTVPAVSLASVSLLRVWAAALAAALTVFGTLAVRPTQPAALSTTLVVSLENMQRLAGRGSHHDRHPRDDRHRRAAAYLARARDEERMNHARKQKRPRSFAEPFLPSSATLQLLLS